MKTAGKFVAALGALLSLPHLAWGHHFMDSGLPQTFGQGFLSGLGHPVIGVDHAAFIVASGFLLALVEGGMWGIGALIAGSLVGATLHLFGFGLPGGEAGVALSVVLVGSLLIARSRIRLLWLACGLALAGVLHGHAYAETIFGAEAVPLGAYLAGFSLVQFGMAAASFLCHRHLLRTRVAWARLVSSGLGVTVGTIGLAFMALNIAG